MNATRALDLEREKAAASIQWPKKTPILMNPDPVVRRKFYGMLALMIFGLVMAIGPNAPSISLRDMYKNHQMRPAMEAAMQSGSRAAGTWLATHYAKEYPGLLQTEANAGEPTAMFLMGRDLVQDPHPESHFSIDHSFTLEQVKAEGIDLVRKAAAAGNQDALLYEATHGGQS
jgi:hypothetical protein